VSELSLISHVKQILGVMALVASFFVTFPLLLTGNFVLLAFLEVLSFLATVANIVPKDNAIFIYTHFYFCTTIVQCHWPVS